MPSFTIGRFKIQESQSANNELQILSWSINSDNIVTIEWTWPKDTAYKMAIVFEAEEFSNDSLETLLSRNNNPVIITKSMDKNYVKPISAEKRSFKVFPAKFGDGNEIIVADQKGGNATGILVRKIRVDYDITYRSILFSDYQKVTITATPYGDLAPEAVMYERYANNRLICRYPLDNVPGKCFFYIKKYEDIKITAAEKYKDTLDIKVKNRVDMKILKG